MSLANGRPDAPPEEIEQHADALLRAAEQAVHAINEGSWRKTAVGVTRAAQLLEHAGRLLAASEELA